MKKVIVLTFALVLLIGTVSAMDMSIGLGGLVGVNNSGVKGVAVGGGVDINLNLYKGFGIEIDTDIVTSKLSSGDGLNVEGDFSVNIPVMAWYNHDFNRLGFGGGLGLGCNISSGVKFTLAGGLEARYNINDQFSIFIGVNGALDVLPTLTKVESGNTSTYKFVKTDFSKNSLYGRVGVKYNIALNN